MNYPKVEACVRFIISPIIFVVILFFGWLEKYVNKNRIRLNKYYVCSIVGNEAVLDNKPKWIYFNADSTKFLIYRQEAIAHIRSQYQQINISTTTITLQVLLERNGLQGVPIHKALSHYRAESYYLTLCNFHNWKNKLIKKRFAQICTGTPKKYLFK